ncbi:MAG: response regulator [Paludibacter sp.]
METNLNKLLKRQINKHFGSTDNLPVEMKGIIMDINETYNNFDDDTRLIQNSIEISSQELRDAFQKQKLDAAAQKETIRKIKEAIIALNPTEYDNIYDSEEKTSDSSYLFEWLIKLIEERKKVENELIILKSAVEQSSSTVVITGLDGSIQFANQKFHETSGYSIQEAIGQNPRILKSNELKPEKYKELWNTILSGNEWHGEFHNKRKDGTLYWESASISPIRDLSGKMTSFLAVKEDITKRKQSEKDLEQITTRLSLATRAGGVGVWDLDLVNNILLWDDQMFLLYGIPKDNFGGAYETWKDGVHPDDVVRGDLEIQKAISGEKEFDTEFRVVWPDGTIHNIKALAIVQRDELGKPMRMIGTNWDITEKKIAEEKLLKALEAAETANKAKSEFLANMSHEIRTPLNGVIGFTDLLQSTPLSPMQHQYVKNANVSGRNLLGIINDILDFSKIEAGMMNLEIIKTDMIELLGQSVDIIKYVADKKSLEVLLNIDNNMPRFAFVDPVRLKQIFANLLGNAVKFTQKGEIELKVSYVDVDNKKGRFSFTVRDTGIGITQEQQSRLFKVFSQADSSITRKYGGTGLGLAISQMIVNKMDSGISIASTEGIGTTFYFDIVTEVERGQKIDNSVLLSIKRCFVIDDNKNNRTILEHTMANWGIECVSCDNGFDALKIIETSEPFDIIICDYHMPFVDGLETIRMISEKLNLSPDKQPIILLHSSSDDAELHRKCDELGVHFRLTKPVKADELYHYLCNLNIEPDKNVEVQPVQKNEEIQAIEKIATILIAEDNNFNMILVKALVARILPTAHIIEAVNGLEAIKFCRSEQPDLILMDMQMPEMNGVDATIQIREQEKTTNHHTPIVALTAGVLKEEQEKCMNAGMDDFLTKPIDNELLKKIILKYLKIVSN